MVSVKALILANDDTKIRLTRKIPNIFIKHFLIEGEKMLSAKYEGCKVQIPVSEVRNLFIFL